MKIILLGGCGYIGSRLFNFLKTDYQIDTVDLEIFGNYVNDKNFCFDFKYLNASFFDKYDVVILLAAHSSVAMCEKNPLGSFENNVNNFINLLDKIKYKKFVYASSSSLYNSDSDMECTEDCNSNFKLVNYYDIGKRVNDYFMTISKMDYYGLRFGTVNGYSPNFRNDIMINKMYLSALNNKFIELYNPNISRPILGMNDLLRAIKTIIQKSSNPGIYNLASFNATIGDIVNSVASYFKDVKVENKGETPSYNFRISTKKFCDNFNFKFEDTVTSIVEDINNNNFVNSNSRNLYV